MNSTAPASRSIPAVDFFFDLTSPYSYLAATQIEAVADRHGAQVRWRPMVLGAVFKATGNDTPARIASKAAYMLADLGRWATQYRVPFRFASRFPVLSVKAMRLVLAAEEQGRGAAVAQAAFRAQWVTDRDITALPVLRALAEEGGVDADVALARIEAPDVKDRLRQNTDEAIARGVFGAPAIFVDDKLFWGNDRLSHVEAALSLVDRRV